MILKLKPCLAQRTSLKVLKIIPNRISLRENTLNCLSGGILMLRLLQPGTLPPFTVIAITQTNSTGIPAQGAHNMAFMPPNNDVYYMSSVPPNNGVHDMSFVPISSTTFSTTIRHRFHLIRMTKHSISHNFHLNTK
ncbi:hypothetical protein G9A89_002494 [Geosiphon pyriformis]|nr:hypothetical protein G9A89_002494 [Geosiphon pyriformis]